MSVNVSSLAMFKKPALALKLLLHFCNTLSAQNPVYGKPNLQNYKRKFSITTENTQYYTPYVTHFETKHFKVHFNVTRSDTEYPVKPSMILHIHWGRTGIYVPKERFRNKTQKYYIGIPSFLNATWYNSMTNAYHSADNQCSYFRLVSSSHPSYTFISNAPVTMPIYF